MDEKLLLKSAEHKLAQDKEYNIKLTLDSDKKLLSNGDFAGYISEYEQYIKEFDNSEQYRVIATIRPYCTNILFNALTEIVYKEGSDECVVFNKNGCSSQETITNDKGINDYLKYKSFYSYGRNSVLNSTYMIKDTSFSSPEIGNIVYHNGLDIFNNHNLRRTKFSVVNKLGTSTFGYTGINSINFNTISDTLRDNKGKEIKDFVDYDIDQTTRHLYTVDSIDGFMKTIRKRLVEDNGWFGFVNYALPDIKNYVFNNHKVSLNRCINNKKCGEFVDMYPDRTLFSFTPKINKYRGNRTEYNWKYCITYPYRNYYKCDLIKSRKYKINGIKCVVDDKFDLINKNDLESNTYDYNEYGSVTFKTLLRHNLKEGSIVRVYINGTPSMQTTVLSTGKDGYDNDYYVTVGASDICEVFEREFTPNDIYNELHSNADIRIVNILNDIECKYYIRVFRRLPDFNNTNVYSDNDTILSDNDIKNNNKGNFNGTLNNLAFSKTIYNEDVCQIIFNNKIKTNGLLDNLKRPLSELFLTIIKNNSGYKEWYKDKYYRAPNVEYSHCFGEVTSGFDLPYDDDPKKMSRDYNVHCIHNVDKSDNNLSGIHKDIIPDGSLALERNITVNNEEFYGDIVELSPLELNEVVLEDVQHRFNTFQREDLTTKPEMYNILYDELESDDYTYRTKTTVRDGVEIPSGYTFYVSENNILNRKFKSRDVGENGEYVENYETYNGNIFPEGYYYKPHYRIPLKPLDEVANVGKNFKISVKHKGRCVIDLMDYLVFENNSGVPIIYDEDIIVYSKKNKKKYYIKNKSTNVNEIVVSNNALEIKSNLLISKEEIESLVFYKKNRSSTEYAYKLDDVEDTFVWKDKMSVIDYNVNDISEEEPFSNGTHYRYIDINFYLKRQDPFGLYGLKYNYNTPRNLRNLIIDGMYKDVSKFEFVSETNDVVC